jgi:luciferase-type oxidoreductase
MKRDDSTHNLSGHISFNKVFQPRRLTIGFIAPAEGYPDSPAPTLSDQAEIVRMLDNIDAAALWLRDVPFYDPSFGDVGQIIDPLVYTGWLAAMTRNIAIGTAGIVSPLRDPVIMAKQIASADQLLGGRFLAGMASGDRATEYPALGIDFHTRTERYREIIEMLRVLTAEIFPTYSSKYYGELLGNLDLIPKPAAPVLPIMAIGRAGQRIEWLAEHVDGWIWHGLDARRMADIVPQWRELTAGYGFKPYGYGAMFDLDSNPDAPLQTSRILRGGRKALVEFLYKQQDAGINHIALNLRPTRRRALDVLEEMGKYILPEFSTHKNL